MLLVKQFSTSFIIKCIPGIEDEYVRLSIQDTNEVLEFAIQTLQKAKQPREDYREFLELVIIFLGGTPPRGISFRGQGAFHHARWMAKAIYCLKIYLFRGEFTLTKEEKIGIRDICIFLAELYLKAWIQSPMAAKAPRLDLEFLKNLNAYREVDNKISRCAINKLSAAETATLAFYDDDIG